MGEGNGAEESSRAESQPSRPAVAGSSRPVCISYSSHDAVAADPRYKAFLKKMNLPDD